MNFKYNNFAKFSLIILFIVIVLIIPAKLITGNVIQDKINVEKANLQLIAVEKANQINNFLQEQENIHKILASMDVFREVILNPDNLDNIERAKDKVNELDYIAPGISILNNNGIVIVGENDLPGTDYSNQPYFTLKDKKIVLERYYDSKRKQDFYAIVGPIYDSEVKDKIIGVIAFDLKLSEVSNLMKEDKNNQDKDIYLIDNTGLLLSDSRYIGKGNKNGVLIQDVNSEGATTCLNDLMKFGKGDYIEDHEDEVMKYTNYMGNEVYGAHSYSMLINGCVIAEENVNQDNSNSLLDYIKSIIIKKEVKNEN